MRYGSESLRVIIPETHRLIRMQTVCFLSEGGVTVLNDYFSTASQVKSGDISFEVYGLGICTKYGQEDETYDYISDVTCSERDMELLFDTICRGEVTATTLRYILEDYVDC